MLDVENGTTVDLPKQPEYVTWMREALKEWSREWGSVLLTASPAAMEGIQALPSFMPGAKRSPS
jgi:hypothetical protein